MKMIKPYKIEKRNIWVIVGDLFLSDFEPELTNAWTQLLAGMERGFRVTSAIYRIVENFGEEQDIDYVLIDIGPNMGALNRSILLTFMRHEENREEFITNMASKELKMKLK